LIHFLHFLENSQRHHYAADASVYLVNMKRQIYYAHRQKKYVLNQITYTVCTQNWVHFLQFSENSQRHHSVADASSYLVNMKRQIYYAHRQKKYVLIQITYTVCTQILIHFLHFLENSQRHHSAADARVYLVNMKRQIYYAHRQKKYVLNQITYTVCTQNWVHFLQFSENSQRHHSAADASSYLVNIKRQIYYAHRQKKYVLNQITYTVYVRKF
jgi:hypothetical protein